ncbi:anti-sigma factor family protein [Streptomyces naganishii]|uniref:anti-sigma factor family protein n=1 Tax=Streptomyces naganishii TaxID=285447 RepID=UPI00369ACBCC
MTATTDTAGHPDVTEISDLTEGLLSASRTEDVRRHLDECEQCAQIHASLGEIRGLLGAMSETDAMPEAQAMPQDVADRIDAALAAEAARASTEVSGDGAHVSRETSVEDRPHRTPADRPSGHARASSAGPGRAARTRRSRRRIAALGSAFTVAALGVVSLVLATTHEGKDGGTTAQGRPSASADTFASGTLQHQVAGLLQKAQKSQGTTHAPHSFGVDSATGTDGPNVLKSQPTVSVPSCVRQAINNSGTPLAAQPGTYDGKSAYLVVLPDTSGDTTRVTAYVVDASCVQRPSAAAKVLLTHSYARS